MVEEKVTRQFIEEKLATEKEMAWDPQKKGEIFALSERFKCFLDAAKTERESVREAERFAQENGFMLLTELQEKAANGEIQDVMGKKFYHINRDKNIIMGVLGKEINKGIKAIVSHVDAPRLDLKLRPFYEDSDSTLAFAKTHYYGGIKKYQWLNIPLALHGTVVKENGEVVNLVIGEDEADPTFVICDLLPHLSRKTQGKDKASELITGEQLNVLMASLPFIEEMSKEEQKMFFTSLKKSVYFHLLKILYEEYGLIEEDFTTAEVEIVPAFRARDLGLDRGLIASYGMDDRVCAFLSMEALNEIKNPERTCAIWFADKEEIGSEGNTSAQSRYFTNVISDIVNLYEPKAPESYLWKILNESHILSADVSAGLNPNFKEVYDMKNVPKLGYGVVMTKATGARGKSGANDANPEYLAQLRQIMNQHKIKWQIGEMGKVDEGGGGTVAMFLAKSGAEVVDCGPALLSMHSPYEVCSKADIYELYRFFKVFMNEL